MNIQLSERTSQQQGVTETGVYDHKSRAYHDVNTRL